MHHRVFVSLFAFLILALAVAWPPDAPGHAQPKGEDDPLPGEMVNIDIDAPQNQSYRLAIVDFFGHRAHGAEGASILRNDFSLMPGYRVLDGRTIVHDVEGEGLSANPATWGRYQANGVVKGQVSEEAGGKIRMDLRFIHFAQGAAPALSKTYTGTTKDIRGWMHDFGNEMLRIMTGKAGVFGTEITYARRVGPGRKDVFCSGMDGYGEIRLTNGRGIAMLPSFDEGGKHVWFTRLTEMGMFITKSG
ncbi:MAG: hypothetical protein KC416_03575, partial [Myxococcales bacterium]|nr:hypothetical protein [Myxococcales bacterium]